jgi:O-antigen/teichoic acid export membrane protein
MLAFALPIAACFIAGADEIVRLLFGEDFAAAAPILRLLAINLVSFALIGIFWRALMARRRQNAVVAVQAVTSAVRVGGAVLLAGPFGALGAAISFVGTSLLHLGLLAHWTARSGARPRIVEGGWRFAVAAGATGLVVWALEPRVPLIAALVGGGVVYVAVALALRAVTPDDRAILRALRASRAAA